MSKLGHSDSDPVCNFFKTVGEVECVDINDYSKCIDNPLCSWGSSEGQSPSLHVPPTQRVDF